MEVECRLLLTRARVGVQEVEAFPRNGSRRRSPTQNLVAKLVAKPAEVRGTRRYTLFRTAVILDSQRHKLGRGETGRTAPEPTINPLVVGSKPTRPI
jgi:hypothetical protein